MVTTVGGDAIESRLTIGRAAAAAHSGTYECSPDNIKPAKIYLHVVEGWVNCNLQRSAKRCGSLLSYSRQSQEEN